MSPVVLGNTGRPVLMNIYGWQMEPELLDVLISLMTKIEMTNVAMTTISMTMATTILLQGCQYINRALTDSSLFTPTIR